MTISVGSFWCPLRPTPLAKLLFRCHPAYHLWGMTLPAQGYSECKRLPFGYLHPVGIMNTINPFSHAYTFWPFVTNSSLALYCNCSPQHDWTIRKHAIVIGLGAGRKSTYPGAHWINRWKATPLRPISCLTSCPRTSGT